MNRISRQRLTAVPAPLGWSRARRARCDQVLTQLAYGAVAAALFGHELRDRLDRRGRVRHGAREPDTFERGQIVQVIADERDLVQLEPVLAAQLVDGESFVRNATE